MFYLYYYFAHVRQVLRRSHAIVFVIDAQNDPYSEALAHLVKIASQAYRVFMLS